jgi:hypothetical protein
MANRTTKPVEFNSIDGAYTFECPHCDVLIQLFKTDLNCLIFRHATYKNTQMPINPHSPKEKCDRLVKEGLVDGCAKPFMFHNKHPPYVEASGYI